MVTKSFCMEKNITIIQKCYTCISIHNAEQFSVISVQYTSQSFSRFPNEHEQMKERERARLNVKG